MTELYNFTDLFHSIQGATYKDKQKNFNEYIRLLKSNVSNVDDIDKLLQSITPKSYPEEVFKIEIAMVFKRHKLLLDELKTCNRTLVKRLLKDWRLYGEIFNNVTAPELIGDILPQLSYSLQLKVLNGISKNVVNEELLDTFFVLLQQKYGLKSASIILPGCSIGVIRSQMEKYHFKLSANHLKRIFKKDHQFVNFYFNIVTEKYKDIYLIYEYMSVLKYIARVNPNIYWTLQEKYMLRVRFGKYLTPKMIKSHKNITEGKFTALETLHTLKMYKTLKKEKKLRDFLLNLYPETHDKFISVIHDPRLLKFISKGPYFKEYYTVSSCFSEKYHKNLLDYPDCFTEKFLTMTPITERTIILDYKIKQFESLKYLYDSSTVIPTIKLQMQRCSNSETKKQCANTLVDTCIANRNKTALLEVIEFIMSRYKNDLDLLKSFLTKLIGSWPYRQLETLTMEHMSLMFSIVQILNKANTSISTEEVFLEHYIRRLLPDGESVSEIVRSHIKKMLDSQRYCFITNNTNKSLQIAYTNEIVKCIDSFREHKNYPILYNRFACFLGYQCKLGKGDFYRYKRLIIDMDQSEWYYNLIMSKAIQCDDDALHNVFWNCVTKCSQYSDYSNAALSWYIFNRPDKLKENCEKLWGKLVERRNEKIFIKLKRFCDDEILNELRKYAIDNVNQADYDKIKYCVPALSILSPETFRNLIGNEFPAEGRKIDLEESEEKTKRTKLFMNSLKFIEDSSEAFTLILKFCVGDYLKFALPSLYSITYNMKENLVEDRLKQLGNNPVSVKKHLLTLSRHLFTYDNFYGLLKNWSETEKNPSLRNIILKKNIEYFVENPSDNLWCLLEKNLNHIDANDADLYDFLLKFQKIPLEYQAKYFELIYDVISKSSGIKSNEKRFTLLDSIPSKQINKLSDEFLKRAIEESVCARKSIVEFHWKCVFYVEEERGLPLLEVNFKKFRDYVEENRSNLLKSDTRSKISQFLQTFLRNAIQLRMGEKLVEKFKANWVAIFTSEDFRRDFIMIEFADLSFKSGFDFYALGVKMNVLFYEYITKRYNVSVIDCFCRRLKDFITLSNSREANALSREKNMFVFVDGFFSNKVDENIYAAVIYFLPKTIPTSENAYSSYLPIFEMVAKCETSTVRYYFDLYLSGEIP